MSVALIARSHGTDDLTGRQAISSILADVLVHRPDVAVYETHVDVVTARESPQSPPYRGVPRGAAPGLAMPARWARTTAWTRSRRCSLAKIRET